MREGERKCSSGLYDSYHERYVHYNPTLGSNGPNQTLNIKFQILNIRIVNFIEFHVISLKNNNSS